MHRAKPLPLIAALLALGALLWWWPNRPRDAGPATAAPYASISFAPYRAGESPLTGRFPDRAEAASDMGLVAGRTRRVRTYAAIEGDYDAAALARAHGLMLWQGIWLGSDRAANEREIARGIALAARYPDVIDRLVVGNEVLLRRDLPPAELMADIDRVRASVRQPVTYADVWEFWTQFPEVARHVDIVTLHLLPYWEDSPTGVGRAVAHVEEVYRRMAALFPGRRIAIGETGWPSRGRWRRDAAPGVVNQATFLRQFVALAARDGFDYNLIEAFDQDWKYHSEGTVGAAWGLWSDARVPKFPLSGPVVEDPAWRRHALGSAACFLLLLGFVRAAIPGPGARHPAATSLAACLGLALGYAAAATAPDLYDLHLRLAAAVNLAGQAVLAALVLLRAASILDGTAPPTARNGADTTRAVQSLLALQPPRTGRDGLLEDLSFLFVWSAAVLQLLLVFDPRYRDFPLPQYAVPLVAVAARALLGDLPRVGGGREELWAGATLAIGAAASTIGEGPRNLQALAWNAAALLLAMPPLLRCMGTWRRAGALLRTPPGARRPAPGITAGHPDGSAG